MERLTRLPWIGPWIARGMRTHGWRAFEHAQAVQWSRLAAAITFTSFIAMFPLIALGAAIGTALLSDRQLDELIAKVNEQIPGLARQLDIAGLAAHAATVGVIAGALLLLTGISWISDLRGCLRAVWGLETERENALLRKVLDGAVLVGLGGVGLLSLICSALATTAVGWTAEHIGLTRGGVGSLLLTTAGYGVAVAADFLLLLYALTLLPGVRPGRRLVVEAALLGAVGLEALKVLIAGYLRQVAGRSIYGAFGTPVALQLWIYFMAELLLYCAAWTATRPGPGPVTDAGGGPPRDSASDAGPPPTARPAPPAPPR